MTTDADRQAREDDREERIDERRRDSLWLAAQARTLGAGRAALIVQAAELTPMPPLPAHTESAEEVADRLIAEERVLAECAGTDGLPGYEGAVLTHALHVAARVASRFILNNLPEDARRYAGAFDVIDRRLSAHIARGAA